MFSEQEFIVRFGLLIAAAGFSDNNGKGLWMGDNEQEESAWGTIVPKVSFVKIMPLTGLRHSDNLCPACMRMIK